ncbi:MAG: hypothetical protein PHV34_23685 [Verrucomicrobiae bacterium]|nr:hypothetical protein [Verrucomicrobiae bacterium]
MTQAMAELRRQLLSDPYFKNVPSMKVEEGKTALFFHAKDDLPEVRREMFKLLGSHRLHFSAVVRDKQSVLAYVRSRNENSSEYRYRADELYDYMLRRLFKQRLHLHAAYHVVFARRGKSDRTKALRHALETSRERFADDQGIDNNASLEILPSSPVREAGLQAVDYFLWALQRVFERHEDRFIQLLWPQCSLIVDMDDTREKGERAGGQMHENRRFGNVG